MTIFHKGRYLFLLTYQLLVVRSGSSNLLAGKNFLCITLASLTMLCVTNSIFSRAKKKM